MSNWLMENFYLLKIRDAFIAGRSMNKIKQWWNSALLWWVQTLCRHDYRLLKTHIKKYDCNNIGDVVEVSLFKGILSEYGENLYGYSEIKCLICGKHYEKN